MLIYTHIIYIYIPAGGVIWWAHDAKLYDLIHIYPYICVFST
jgi:hypothetical protein